MNGHTKLAERLQQRAGWIVAAGLLVVPLVGTLARQMRPDHRIVLAGAAAPAFSLPVARGGRCNLADLLAKKRTVVLSFIDASTQPFSRIHPVPSRGQMVFLKSMAQQYGPNGVGVVIVACNGLLREKPVTQGALLNFSYDWQLDSIAVLRDEENTAGRYEVSTLPTTLLIGHDGLIRRRWDGIAAPAPLAFALESYVGPARFRR